MLILVHIKTGYKALVVEKKKGSIFSVQINRPVEQNKEHSYRLMYLRTCHMMEEALQGWLFNRCDD